MVNDLFQNYLEEIFKIKKRGDAREESYYTALKNLIEAYGKTLGKKIEVTVLPKKSEAGNPDFRVWNGESEIIGYIEAKRPFEDNSNLDYIENTKQLIRYRQAYPNLIITNFLEFRLYRNSECFKKVEIIDNYQSDQRIHKGELIKFFDLFFDFSQPRIKTLESLAEILSKKAIIMRDYIVLPSLQEEIHLPEDSEMKYFTPLYDSFKTYLLKNLTQEEFADLFAQTFIYGLFIAKCQHEAKGILFEKKVSELPFTTKTAYDFIQKSFGILREVFRVISTADMSEMLKIIVDDIVDVLNHTEIYELLNKDNNKTKDPIYHLYETFLYNM